MSLNSIVLMGRMTRDPELRYTQSGAAVASFTLAVDRDYVQQGQQRETDFIDCVAWKGTGEFVSKYFFKGKMAVVAGRLQKRTYEDRNGNKREAAEVVCSNVYFGDSKKNDDGYQQMDGRPQQSYQANREPQYEQLGYGAQGTPFEEQYEQQRMSTYEGLEDDGELPF